ncbi:hypothetical protein [Burkholderia pyrrocinia]|uniref:hypothetical protein n=1 Tax=Burkholderia pyrrocinia TaxID=60550 RepID=UPI0035C6BD2B
MPRPRPAALSRGAAVPPNGALSVARIAGQVMRVAFYPVFPLDQCTPPLNRRHEQKLVHHRQEFPTRFLRECGKLEQQCEYFPYMTHGVPLQYRFEICRATCVGTLPLLFWIRVDAYAAVDYLSCKAVS